EFVCPFNGVPLIRMDAPIKTSLVLTFLTSMRVVFCASNHTGSHTIAISAIAFFIFVLIFFIKHNRSEGCLCLYFMYLPYASITWIRFPKEFNSEKQIHLMGLISALYSKESGHPLLMLQR